uniref:Uncharacterized protein n=1 Tax=Plectus sambesii TaxID=2011161 RepID=A0A914X0W2_9BILA
MRREGGRAVGGCAPRRAIVSDRHRAATILQSTTQAIGATDAFRALLYKLALRTDLIGPLLQPSSTKQELTVMTARQTAPMIASDGASTATPREINCPQEMADFAKLEPRRSPNAVLADGPTISQQRLAVIESVHFIASSPQASGLA